LDCLSMSKTAPSFPLVLRSIVSGDTDSWSLLGMPLLMEVSRSRGIQTRITVVTRYISRATNGPPRRGMKLCLLPSRAYPIMTNCLCLHLQLTSRQEESLVLFLTSKDNLDFIKCTV
jgi:hypothetical protein